MTDEPAHTAVIRKRHQDKTQPEEAWDEGYLAGYQDRAAENSYDLGDNPYRNAEYVDDWDDGSKY